MTAWSPPQTALRIFFTSNLVDEAARREDDPELIGLIYGTRTLDEVHVISTEPHNGLDPVGVFSARPRGEVFLTEDDLARLDTFDEDALDSPAAIAFVSAGAAAGFFVREPDGSMQTIKSYQEFPIVQPAIEKTPLSMPPSMRWISLAVAAFAAVTILAWPSRAFSIDRHNDQVRIALRRSARPGARLEITDGATRQTVAITPSLTSVLYSPRTSDVHVKLVR